MPKFFVQPDQICEGRIRIIGEDAKHIATVLRMKSDDKIIVCDGQSVDYECIIRVVNPEGIETQILQTYHSEAESNVKVTLFQALPKLDKMDLIIQKCVELGIDEIVPMTTERTVVKIGEEKKSQKKLERWNKVAESAAKQCGRGKIPQVSDIVTFKQATEQSKTLNLRMVAYEKEQNTNLRSILSQFDGLSAGIFIGPEGGFSEKEIDYACQVGIKPITLGKRILRTETAGFLALSIIMYEMGEM